jgi:hypothetical protein
MTTKAQIRQLARPLLERHPDLILASAAGGLIIAVRPVAHLLRFVILDRTGSADTFQPQWSVNCLFIKREHLNLFYEGWLRRRGPQRLWRWSDPAVAEEFVTPVEEQALPRLAELTTLEAFERFTLAADPPRGEYMNGFRALMAMARGDLDAAAALMDTGPRPWGTAALDQEHDGLGTRLKAQGAKLSPEDRRALAAMLHRWEAYSVEKLRLGPVWQRTPFPLELGVRAA